MTDQQRIPIESELSDEEELLNIPIRTMPDMPGDPDFNKMSHVELQELARRPLTDCSEILQFFKSGDEKALVSFLVDKNTKGYVRDPCIPERVYKQEPNCPPNFPFTHGDIYPGRYKLTPLQWLAIFMNKGIYDEDEDKISNKAVEYYMLNVIKDYGADGEGEGDYKDCFFKAPVSRFRHYALDYSPVVLACIFNNEEFLKMVNVSCEYDTTLFDSGYQPFRKGGKGDGQHLGDVRQFMPVQIAALLGSNDVTAFLIFILEIRPNQIPNNQTLLNYKGSKFRVLHPITLGIIGFGLKALKGRRSEWDAVSASVRPSRTRDMYVETIHVLLERHVELPHKFDLFQPHVHNFGDSVAPSNWSPMYELIYCAFGKEYTKGSEQDLFNMDVFNVFLPRFYSEKFGYEGERVDEIEWDIGAHQVLHYLNKTSNLSTRKENPSPISKDEKVRRRMFIYDSLVERRDLLTPKIEEQQLKNLIIKNVEETFPYMMKELIRQGYHTLSSIATIQLEREKKNVLRLKGSEQLDEKTLKKINSYITKTGGKRKTKKKKRRLSKKRRSKKTRKRTRKATRRKRKAKKI